MPPERTHSMIAVRGLSKRYGEKIAVNDLSFDVVPGKVTGFLGPNGAGKTTTMRLILGLDYPNAGSVTIDGKRYASLANPMREVEHTADQLIVIGRGQLLADCTMEEFIARSSGQTVRVATPQPDQLVKAVADAGGSAVNGADGTLIVSGLVAAQVGDIAFEHGVRLHELTVVRASLEAAFMELTADSVEYRGGEN